MISSICSGARAGSPPGLHWSNCLRVLPHRRVAALADVGDDRRRLARGPRSCAVSANDFVRADFSSGRARRSSVDDGRIVHTYAAMLDLRIATPWSSPPRHSGSTRPRPRRQRWPMVVTSHDVARLAGVSQPTVSRALRDSTKVSDARPGAGCARRPTALGYVPSETGRALSIGRTQRVGLLLTDLENQFYPHVIAPDAPSSWRRWATSWCCTPSPPTPGRVAERLVANSPRRRAARHHDVDSLLPVRLRDRRPALRLLQPHRASFGRGRLGRGRRRRAGCSSRRSGCSSSGTAGSARSSDRSNTSTASSGRPRSAAPRRGSGLSAGRADRTAGRSTSHRCGRGHARLLQVVPAPTVLVCGNDVRRLRGAERGALSWAVGCRRTCRSSGSTTCPRPLAALQLTTVAFDLDAMARRGRRPAGHRIGRPSTPSRTRFETTFVERRTLAAAPHS